MTQRNKRWRKTIFTKCISETPLKSLGTSIPRVFRVIFYDLSQVQQLCKEFEKQFLLSVQTSKCTLFVAYGGSIYDIPLSFFFETRFFRGLISGT